MRTLLIGGNGFIGRPLAALLQRNGHQVAVLHSGTTALPPGLEEICGDRNRLANSAHDLKRFAPDVVIDLVLSSARQAEELMNAFRGATGRVVMLSSIDVYRAIGVTHGTETGPLQELPLTEDSEVRRNLHPYPPDSMRMLRQIFSWATDDYDKIPAERVVMNDAELPATVLRLPMVYGPGDPLHRFYPVVRRITDGRRQILFPAPQAAWRSPRGYVGNVGAAIALAASDSSAAGRTYNICEEPAFSELEWAKKIAAEMRWHGEFVVLPAERTPRHLLQPGNYEQHWTASSTRIRRDLGYGEPVTIEEAIQQTVAWEKEKPPTLPFAQFDYAAEDAALAAEPDLPSR
jgi:nucleoside-diphosphate-sugar epimerase